MSLLVDMGPACMCADNDTAGHDAGCARGVYLTGFRDGYRTGNSEGYARGGHDAVRAAAELNRRLQDTTFRESLATLLLFVIDAEEQT